MKLTGSQIFVEVLVEQGVDTLFGYPGGAVLNLYDELYKNSDRIRHVLTAHEQGASHAADGYARATGRTGVVLATSGPGATNLVTGIATAYMDSVPMVAFTGNVATTLLGKDSFQEAYIEGITMPITKHNYTVRRVEDLADTMRAAFRIAQSGRKGPVLVDIPKDITAASCEFTPKAPELIRTVTRYNEEDVKKAAQMINESERPIVYFGGGVRSAAGCQPLRDLLEKTGMPATYTLMAAGVLSYGEPHNLGLLGMHGCYAANKAIDEADLVIAVGTRFSDRVALNPDSFAKRAKIIQIDIDPSELGKNVDVDLSLTGDASYILQAILPYVKKTEHKLWMEQIRGWQKNDYKPVDSDTELKPHQIIDEICNQAGPEAVYVTDVGQHQMWAAQYLHHTKSRGFLTSGGLGTMGFGLRRGHRRTDGAGQGCPRRHADGRRLVPHEPERGLHCCQLRPAHHHGNFQQSGARYGAPVADDLLREALLRHRPAPQDRLCQAGRGLRGQRLPRCDARRVQGGVRRRDEAEGPELDRLPHRQGRKGPADDPRRRHRQRHHHGMR